MWCAAAVPPGHATRRNKSSVASSRAVVLGLLAVTWAGGLALIRPTADVLLAFLPTLAHPRLAAIGTDEALLSQGAALSPLAASSTAAGGGRLGETSRVAAAAAATGTTVAAGVWMDCDVRFIAAEAHAARVQTLKDEMQKAAASTNFMMAEELKREIAYMTESGPPVAPPPETWLIGGEELFGSFGKFLLARGLQPQDVNIGCETTADGPSDWGSRLCEECSKLHSGGPYGSTGVVTPAYPPPEMASDCLALSQATLDVDTSVYYDRITGSIGDDSFDATSDPSSIAFCRVK